MAMKEAGSCRLRCCLTIQCAVNDCGGFTCTLGDCVTVLVENLKHDGLHAVPNA